MSDPANNVTYLFGNPERLPAQSSEEVQPEDKAFEGLIEGYTDLIRAEEAREIDPEEYGLRLSGLYAKATEAGLSETDMARACGSAMVRLEKEKNNNGQQYFSPVLRLIKE